MDNMDLIDLYHNRVEVILTGRLTIRRFVEIPVTKPLSMEMARMHALAAHMQLMTTPGYRAVIVANDVVVGINKGEVGPNITLPWASIGQGETELYCLTHRGNFAKRLCKYMEIQFTVNNGNVSKYGNMLSVAFDIIGVPENFVAPVIEMLKQNTNINPLVNENRDDYRTRADFHFMKKNCPF